MHSVTLTPGGGLGFPFMASWTECEDTQWKVASILNLFFYLRVSLWDIFFHTSDLYQKTCICAHKGILSEESTLCYIPVVFLMTSSLIWPPHSRLPPPLPRCPWPGRRCRCPAHRAAAPTMHKTVHMPLVSASYFIHSKFSMLHVLHILF